MTKIISSVSKKFSIITTIISILLLSNPQSVSANQNRQQSGSQQVYVALDMVSGTKPDLAMRINQRSLNLDLAKTNNIRLRFNVKDLMTIAPNQGVVAVKIYEIVNGERVFTSQSSLSLNSGARKNRIMAVDAGFFTTPNKQVEIDLIDPANNVVNTYSTLLQAHNLVVQASSDNNVIDFANCDNSIFGECQLDAFFQKVNFVPFRSRQPTSQIVKNENGNYEVRLPYPTRFVNFYRDQRTRVGIESGSDGGTVGRSGGGTSTFDEVLDAATIRLGSSLANYGRITYDSIDDYLIFGHGNNLVTENRVYLHDDGRLGVGVSSPSAYLHLRAGDTTNPPFKMTAGDLTTIPQDGAIEFDGDEFYVTKNGVRIVLGTGGAADLSAGGLLNGEITFLSSAYLQDAVLNGNTLIKKGTINNTFINNGMISKSEIEESMFLDNTVNGVLTLLSGAEILGGVLNGTTIINTTVAKADHATTANTAEFATSAGTAETASFAVSAGSAATATFATNAGVAATATTAETAVTATNLDGGTINNVSLSGQISGGVINGATLLNSNLNNLNLGNSSLENVEILSSIFVNGEISKSEIEESMFLDNTVNGVLTLLSGAEIVGGVLNGTTIINTTVAKADHATTANTAEFATSAGTAETASFAVSAGSAATATFATNAGVAATATTAETAVTATNLDGGTINNVSLSGQISGGVINGATLLNSNLNNLNLGNSSLENVEILSSIFVNGEISKSEIEESLLLDNTVNGVLTLLSGAEILGGVLNGTTIINTTVAKADHATTANTAEFATSAGTAETASFAVSAGSAATADFAINAGAAINAEIAVTATNLDGGTIKNVVLDGEILGGVINGATLLNSNLNNLNLGNSSLENVEILSSIFVNGEISKSEIEESMFLDNTVNGVLTLLTGGEIVGGVLNGTTIINTTVAKADHATTANTAEFATSAGTAETASFAVSAGSAATATFATNAGVAATATTAETAVTATNLDGGTINNVSLSGQISGGVINGATLLNSNLNNLNLGNSSLENVEILSSIFVNGEISKSEIEESMFLDNTVNGVLTLLTGGEIVGGVLNGTTIINTTVAKADHATTANTAEFATSAGTAETASFAVSAGSAATATFATNAGVAATATTAETAVTATNLDGGTINNVSLSGQISGGVINGATLLNSNLSNINLGSSNLEKAEILGSIFGNGVISKSEIEESILLDNTVNGVLTMLTGAEILGGVLNGTTIINTIVGKADHAATADFATSADTATFATNADTAGKANNAVTATNLDGGTIKNATLDGEILGGIINGATLINTTLSINNVDNATTANFAKTAGIAERAKQADTTRVLAGESFVLCTKSDPPRCSEQERPAIIKNATLDGQISGGVINGATLINTTLSINNVDNATIANFAKTAGIAERAKQADFSIKAETAAMATFAKSSGIAETAKFSEEAKRAGTSETTRVLAGESFISRPGSCHYYDVSNLTCYKPAIIKSAVLEGRISGGGIEGAEVINSKARNLNISKSEIEESILLDNTVNGVLTMLTGAEILGGVLNGTTIINTIVGKADHAATADFATSADTATFATNADTAGKANNAVTATNLDGGTIKNATLDGEILGGIINGATLINTTLSINNVDNATTANFAKTAGIAERAKQADTTRVLAGESFVLCTKSDPPRCSEQERPAIIKNATLDGQISGGVINGATLINTTLSINNVDNATIANFAKTAGIAERAKQADFSIKAETAAMATFAKSSGIAETAKFSEEAKIAKFSWSASTAGKANFAINARAADNAVTATNLDGGVVNNATITGTMKLSPQAGAPANPEEGQIYHDASHAICVFMNGSWMKLVGTGSCGSDSDGSDNRHSADFREPYGLIDGTESNRVLAYWRAGGYHVNAKGVDGYAAGMGSQDGKPHSADLNGDWNIDDAEIAYFLTLWRASGYEWSNIKNNFVAVNSPVVRPEYHSADYREPYGLIDGTESNRVLAYWRAGGLRVDKNAPDGYSAWEAKHHSGDVNKDWVINDSELDRARALLASGDMNKLEFNRVYSFWLVGGYHPNAQGYDGYDLGRGNLHSADRDGNWIISEEEKEYFLTLWRAGGYKWNDAIQDFVVNASGALPMLGDINGDGSDNRHSADFREPYGLIDGTESNRVLAYWRAGGYHVNAKGVDGYAAGMGSQDGKPHSADLNGDWNIDDAEIAYFLTLWRASGYEWSNIKNNFVAVNSPVVRPEYHSADYREPYGLIDGTESNRVLAYWRAGGLRVDKNAPDGYSAWEAKHHSGDVNKDWVINDSELDRARALLASGDMNELEFNRVYSFWLVGGYHPNAQGYDGYDLGRGNLHSADRDGNWIISEEEKEYFLTLWRAGGYKWNDAIQDFVVNASGALPMLGDINGDGRWSSIDATLIHRHINAIQNGEESPLTPLQQVLADLDGDGVVTYGDLRMIQMLIVGLITLNDLPRMLGDINGDGRWTAGDTVLIRRHIDAIQNSEESPFAPLSPLQQALADLDGDGRVSELDVELLRKLTVGLITLNDLLKL
jgi:hypothetical protein